MPAVRCVICGDTESQTTYLHRFPRDHLRSSHWQHAMFGQNCISRKMSTQKICSRHFQREEYADIRMFKLKKTAAPSLFPAYISQPEEVNLSEVASELYQKEVSGEARLPDINSPSTSAFIPVIGTSTETDMKENQQKKSDDGTHFTYKKSHGRKCVNEIPNFFLVIISDGGGVTFGLPPFVAEALTTIAGVWFEILLYFRLFLFG